MAASILCLVHQLGPFRAFLSQQMSLEVNSKMTQNWHMDGFTTLLQHFYFGYQLGTVQGCGGQETLPLLVNFPQDLIFRTLCMVIYGMNAKSNMCILWYLPVNFQLCFHLFRLWCWLLPLWKLAYNFSVFVFFFVIYRPIQMETVILQISQFSKLLEIIAFCLSTYISFKLFNQNQELKSEHIFKFSFEDSQGLLDGLYIQHLNIHVGT